VRENIRDGWLVIITAISLASLFIGLHQVDATHRTAVTAERIAERANRQAIENVLHAEKICSNTHQDACRALISRLIANATNAQAHRLACGVLHALDPPSVRKLYLRSGCRPRSP